MKHLLEQALQDTDLQAASELRQRLEAEMCKPADQRDYALIGELSSACCEMMHVRESMEAASAEGIRTVLERLDGQAPEEQSETYIVETVRPSFRRFLPAAAACAMLVLGIFGTGLLRQDLADRITFPEQDTTECSSLAATEQTAPYTVPVVVPDVTDPVETSPPVTMPATDATASYDSMAETLAETAPLPVSTDAVEEAPARQTEAVPETMAAKETTTETVTEPLPEPTATVLPDANATEPVSEASDGTTRLIKLPYALGWVPEGYTLTNQSTEQGEDYEIRILTYTSDDGTIVFRQRTRNAPLLAPFETGETPEDYVLTNLRIGPYPGYLGQSSTGCTLTWDVGEYLFTLIGPDADDLQKAALALYICYQDDE